MDILILGAGAIGSLFGGFLSEAGHNVYFLGREKNNNVIRSSGLLIDGIWGEHRITGLNCFETLDQITEKKIEKFDFVIVSVKSYDTESIVTDYLKHFKLPAPLISLQNGLGNVEIIESLAGTENTIGGRVISGVEYLNPGHIRVTVSAANPVLGCLRNDSIHKAKAAADMFSTAGIKTDLTDNVYTFIWEKVLYNCALNAVSTILDINYGKLLSSLKARDLIFNIITEIYAVIIKENIMVNFKAPVDYTEHLFDVLIPRTFEHHPSMLQDINNNKKTEIDALNGAIVSLSEKHNLYAPCNQTITGIIKSKEQ